MSRQDRESERDKKADVPPKVEQRVLKTPQRELHQSEVDFSLAETADLKPLVPDYYIIPTSYFQAAKIISPTMSCQQS